MKSIRTMWIPDSVRTKLRPAALISLLLWLMLWGGYDTGISLILSPGFPSGAVDLVHGLRALLPLVAGWLALLLIIPRGGFKPRAIAGPLGLLGLFTLAGLISSALFSVEPLEALYWGAMFGSVIVVIMSISSNSETELCVRQVMNLNWLVAIAILLGLLLAIPTFGGAALQPTFGSPLGVMAYGGSLAAHGQILGMPGTRNTGLGRYAAVAGLVALARLCQGGHRKLIWLGVLLVALFGLVLSQARTETLGFIVGGFIIFALRKRRRVLLFGGGALITMFLGLTGFISDFWTFGTRGQGFDPTLTGRTLLWRESWSVIRTSPWVGLGFQADRYFLNGQHMHDALLHALIQAGALGTVAYIGAYVLSWILMYRIYHSKKSEMLPDELPGILAFFTIMSITESTAYYSANWLFIAPMLAYIQVLAWPQRAAHFLARIRSAKLHFVPYAQATPSFGPMGRSRRPKSAP